MANSDTAFVFFKFYPIPEGTIPLNLYMGGEIVLRPKSQYKGGETKKLWLKKKLMTCSMIRKSVNDKKKEPSDESEYEPSDHLDTTSESENEHGNKKKRKKQKFATFNEKTDFHGRVELIVGMCFNDFKVCRSTLRKYAVQRGIHFVFIKNEWRRITIACKRGCGWKVHASPSHKNKAFQIKTWTNMEHKNCGWEFGNTKADSKWLADEYLEHIRVQPHWDNKAFQNQVHRDHKVTMSRY
ncbi:hypothetical protein Cni_G16403 [Canna indica]|uniref:Transposase MuDR plant domain-containing protein n=1 Tax=Canna indica TaxID=4628 RepID=A0AAQ3QCI9_9LILI|nr:hypothetical protein Cni_G16403 [Canna indica]